jgi:hypothetical protein
MMVSGKPAFFGVTFSFAGHGNGNMKRYDYGGYCGSRRTFVRNHWDARDGLLGKRSANSIQSHWRRGGSHNIPRMLDRNCM